LITGLGNGSRMIEAMQNEEEGAKKSQAFALTFFGYFLYL